MKKTAISLSTAALLAALPTAAYAVPYASALSDNGTNYSFVLNQDADLVEVSLDGGAFTSLGSLAAGSHSFALGGASTYNIRVSHSAAEGWTQISDDDKIDNAFFRATGVAVNKDPNSSAFGTVYVTNPGAGGAVIDPLIPLSRDTDMGIYALSADSTTLVAPAPFTTNQGGIDWSLSTTASPFKSYVAPDGQLYIASWADAAPGVWRAPSDLSGTWTQVLANDNQQASGLTDNHGSIPGLYVEGTGASTVLYTVDEDYGNVGDVLRYDIGENLTPYSATPTVQVEDGGDAITSAGGNILNGRMDVVRDEDGSWWVAQYRFDDGGADGELSALLHFQDGATAPDWRSGGATTTHPDGPDLDEGFGTLDLDNDLDVVAVGTLGSSDYGIYILDVTDPTSPQLSPFQLATGDRIDDVAFDAAGNLYYVSRGAERLKVFSPGGDSVVTTGSDGSFLRDLSIDLSAATAIDGDLNGDGFVGVDDLNIVLVNWNQNVTAGDPTVGDPTGDGFVGVDDLNTVLVNWNNGTPPAGAAVPEPASLALLGLGGLAMLKRRR